MNCPHCNAANPDEARFCAACGKATSATEPVSHPHLKAPLELVGKEIAGRYRLQSKLGEGGMGAVYKAEQISLKRTCAVKLLKADVASTELMLRRFDAEAKAVASLSHPNTVNIYDFGQDTDGTFFIAMEFVEGRSLREVIHTESPLPIRRALSVASQVAASLSDAHSHNIIHRDLKPDNVMLQTRGRQKDVARVLDFGIAKLRDEGRATQAAMTQAGDMLGTPQYMAPEQIRADQIDGRTDVYALGCMLYEMITGRMPFEGATVLAILSKHLTETPLPPSQRRPDLQVPPHIDQLVMSAVAKDPNARPASMEIFGEQLSALLAQFPAESGQGTAQVSVPMSAVHGAVGPTIATGPGPGFAMPNAAPFQAPSAAPFQAPYSPPTPPPPGPAPGYGTPQPQPSPAYSPYPAPPPPQHAEPAPAGKTNKLLFVAIGAIVLIGGGIGIFAATRKKDTPVVAVADAAVETPETPDKPETPPDKPETPPDKPETPPDKPAVDPPDAPPKKPPPPTNNGDDEPEEDPWAEDNPTPPTKPPPKKVDETAVIEGMAVRACSCRDAACGQKVLAELVAWVQKFGGKDPPGDQARMTSAAERIGTCLTNLGVSVGS